MRKARDYDRINKHMTSFIHVPQLNLPTLKVKTLVNGKRFYTTLTGAKYPSVTTVLGDQEKAYLTDWRNSMGHKNADRETKRAGARGAAVHKLTELYLKNLLTPEEAKLHTPDDIFLFNQIRLSLNKINNIKVQETPLYSDSLGIAGSVDCIGEYNGVPSVIDFKTSTKNKITSMIGDYFLQATGYVLMWNELTNDTIENITIIMAVEKGIVPLLFHDKIDKYVKPLLIRIDEYNRNHK